MGGKASDGTLSKYLMFVAFTIKKSGWKRWLAKLICPELFETNTITFTLRYDDQLDVTKVYTVDVDISNYSISEYNNRYIPPQC